MSRIRVLVVDDAVVVRRMVTDALASDPDIEVVGTAPNGRVAMAKLDQVNPDVVTLDVEMPEMDGIETLTAIRRRSPDLPVIMFSTLTERGAKTTMDALLRGANDYVTKPANVGSVAEGQQAIRDSLIPRVHALAGARTAGPTAARAAGSRPSAPARPAGRAPSRPVAPPAQLGPDPRFEAIVIGVSTGGPNALAEVIPALPADLPVPVLVVQHMPAMFTRLLAERLDATSPLQVREVAGREPVRAGLVLIAPGDRHLAVVRGASGVVTELRDTPPENSCRPAADVLFRTAAEAYDGHVLAAVLTGMGSDGARGAEAVREAGGRVLIQDEATSVVWGMPGAVARAGLHDAVLSLDRIATTLRERVTATAHAARPPAGVAR